MAFDPLKQGLCTRGLTIVHLGSDGPDEVDVLDILLARCFPQVLFPVDVPLRYTTNRIFTVCDDLDVLIHRDFLHGPKDGSQLCTLVRLRVAFEALGNIPVTWVSRASLREDSMSANLGSFFPKKTPTPATAPTLPLPRLLPSV